MERRRKYNRHFLQTMHTLLPPVLLVTQLSLVLALCSFFILIDYAECIMTFPGESGVYSLFPDEDLKTGRKRLRFDEEAATTIRSYRDGRDYLVRSYPMLPHDRLHRPVDFSGGGGGGGGREGSRQVYDDYNRDRDRERHGRVYFDDSFRSSRFDFHRLNTPRPRPIERPVNPIIFETSRRPYHHFLPDSFPPGPPAIGQSKLPPGASSRASGEDVPTRIHVFNPESNSFGNPRNAGGGGDGNDGTSSSERAKGPPSNFVETGPPGPESFLNHEEFLEYQKKIAFARFHEQDGPSGNGGGGGSSSSSSSGGGGAGKKVLFESKEPFEIDGLVPPDKSGENSGKLPTTSKVPLQQTHGQLSLSSSASPPPPRTQQQRHQNHQILLQHQQEDQRQHQRPQQQQRHHSQQREGQKVRPSPTDATNNHHEQQQPSSSLPPPPQHRHNVDDEAEEERDTGGGEIESVIVNEKGDEVESENGKSEVIQLPPTHITKSGRDHHHHRNHHHHSSSGGDGHSGSVSDHSGGGSSRNGGGSGSSRNGGGGSSNNKKFTPSISHNEGGGGGTGFKLPTTAISYSDEPPNLNGFVPVVPFHLIGAEQPRAISLERPRQQQQQRIVPHHQHHHTLHEAPVRSTAATTTTTTSTTIRSIPVTTITASTTTARSKGEKLGFRPTTEAAKGFTPSSPFSSFIPTGSIDDSSSSNGGSSSGIINSSSFPSSPASPILHATAGERSNSETHSKVAITKQQELKRLQKQRQLTSSMHHPITPPPHSAGLFPDFGLGDSSSDSADNSNDNPGTFTNTLNANDFLDEMREMVTPHSSPRDILSLSSPTSSTPTQQQQQHLVDIIIHNSTPPSTSSTFATIHDPSSEQNTEHKTQDIIITPTEKQSQFNLHTISHIDDHNSYPLPHNTSNFTHDETMIQESSPPPQSEEQKINTLLDLNNSEQEHGSVTLGDDETIKLVATSENNHNGLFDTRAVKIANGIKQGEFLLEGYMINSNNEDGAPFGASPGVGHSSSLSSRSNAEDADYTNNKVDNHMKEENVGNHQHHHGLYDYPDPNDDSLPIIVDEDDAANHSHDNIPLSPVIPQLPGTPDLEQNLTPSYLTTTTKNSTPYLFNNPKNPTFSTGSGGSGGSSSSNSISSSSSTSNSGGVTDDDGSRTTSRQQNGEDVTGNEDFSKSSEPNLVDRNSPSADDRVIVVNSGVDFEAVPTSPPEFRRTRLSEINEEKTNFVVADDQDSPTNPFYNSNHNVVVNNNKDINIAFFPYYDSYGNKINASQQGISGGGSSSSSSSSSSGSLNRNRDGDDEIFSYSGSGEGAYQYQDENGAFENDQFNGLDKTTIQRDRSLAGSSSSSSQANTNNFRSKHTRKSNSKIIKLKMDANGNFIEDDDDDDDNPSSISIPVEASLNYQINNKNHNGVDSTINNDGPNFNSKSSIGSVGGTSGNSVSVADNIENDGFVGIRKSVGASAAAVEDYGPLYLESSETLINKTYYLDGNYNSIHTTSSTNKGKNKNSNSIKSSNFIKVTRIKTSSGSASQETAEKTSATILARRTSKPAVIISTSAAGVRPKVVGSVVEAGPAWPGLVSNFLRTNGQYNTNRSFTATATVRPRGNSGTNPSPPTAVISGQIEQISREQVHQQIHTKHHHRQQSPHTPPPPPQQLQQDPPPTAAIKPTEFQLQQIRTPTTVAGISSATTTASSASSIINDPSANNHESKNRNFANHQNTNANDNHHNTNSSSIIIKKGNSAASSGVNSNLAKQISTNSSNQQQQQQPHNINYNSSSFNININSTDSNSTKTHTITRRLYTSSEEIRSNSSTGVVSLVHAHISHCPKLHSPTEVICDVHIREGHGIANPQLTVGWRRKFYNSTQPDVLLALNRAPPSGLNGHFDPHHSILEVESGKYERLEEFHDKFNVTLAPGISPTLRSVLLIRSVSPKDCGAYVCEINDGINILKSETLLFLCHK